MNTKNRITTLGVLGTAIVGVGFLVVFCVGGLGGTKEMGWVFMAVLGISIFLVLLTLMSFLFTTFNIGDAKEALGLPPGSIRAVIALCLVVVFAIFVVFLYNDLANPPTRSLVNVSQEQYNKISPDQILSSSNFSDDKTGQTLYNVELIGTQRSLAAQDLAKQVVTLVGTLMAAVSSFYFGTKAGEQRATPEESTPSEGKGTALSRKKGRGVL